MSSVTSSVASPALGKKFFVSLVVNANKADPVSGAVVSSTLPVGTVVQDMGVKKTGANGQLLRKVKLFNPASVATADPFDTFYINVNGPTSAWVSLSL